MIDLTQLERESLVMEIQDKVTQDVEMIDIDHSSGKGEMAFGQIDQEDEDEELALVISDDDKEKLKRQLEAEITTS